MSGWQTPASQWGIPEDQAARLPLGLRLSNNLFNIKYVPNAERNQGRWPGLLGPSEARDGGDPQMKFATVEDSGVAGARLALRKYQSGMRTPRAIIAGQMGWTPGYEGAATNIARIAGVGPDDDLRLDTPEGLRRFLPALAEQEHGKGVAQRLFRPELFDRVVARVNGQPVAAPAPAATTETSMPRDLGRAAAWSDMAGLVPTDLIPGASDLPAWAAATNSAPRPETTGSVPRPVGPMPIGDRVAEPAASPGLLDMLRTAYMNPMVQGGLGMFLAGRAGTDANAGLDSGIGRSNSLMANHMKLQEMQRQNLARQQAPGLLAEYQRAAAGQGVGQPASPELANVLGRMAMNPNTADIATRQLGQMGMPQTTDDIKEYNFAKQQGDTRSFQEWMAAKKSQGGDKYGKSGVIFQGQDGKFYSAQFGGDGTRKVEVVVAADGTPLAPAKGFTVVGDTQFNNATGQSTQNVGASLAGGETAKELGTAQGKALVALPAIENAADNAARTLAQIRNHPGRQYAVGVSGVLPGVPGTMQNDFVKLVDQAAGQAFLQAYDALRGGGAITEAEGLKATFATFRAARTQTPEGFAKALDDFERELQKGLATARKKAAGGFVPPGTQGVVPPRGQGGTAQGAPEPQPSQSSTPAVSAPLDEARRAIAAGAPRDKVIERLRGIGVDPAGL